jgi:hypothetical protein
MTASTPPARRRPEVHDFDFFMGRWTVRHRRLRTRGVGAADWDEFDSLAECRPFLGGVANVEEQVCSARGWRGMAVRALDLATGVWSISWISDVDGRVQPPVLGRFSNGLGVFEGPDLDGDRPILVRFEWSRTDTDSPRWAQAFSRDEGDSWETNWIMDFRRVAD